MKNKLTKAELIKNINDSTGIDAVSIGIVINQMFEELKEALLALGYKNSDIQKVLTKVNANNTIEVQIKEG